MMAIQILVDDGSGLWIGRVEVRRDFKSSADVPHDGVALSQDEPFVLLSKILQTRHHSKRKHL